MPPIFEYLRSGRQIGQFLRESVAERRKSGKFAQVLDYGSKEDSAFAVQGAVQRRNRLLLRFPESDLRYRSYRGGRHHIQVSYECDEGQKRIREQESPHPHRANPAQDERTVIKIGVRWIARYIG